MTDQERKEVLERSRKELEETIGMDVEMHEVRAKDGEDPIDMLIHAFRTVAKNSRQEVTMTMLTTLNISGVDQQVQMVIMGEVYSYMARSAARDLGRTMGVLRSAFDFAIANESNSPDIREDAAMALLGVSKAMGSFNKLMMDAFNEGITQGKAEADKIHDRVRSGK